MKRRAGFTVVELIITITIMAILLTVSVVSLRNVQANARDEERKTDITNLAMFFERKYTRDNGSYLPNYAVSTNAYLESFFFTGVDRRDLRAPGVESPNYSLKPATNAVQTTTGVQPQPTINEYVFQPITTTDALCTATQACRKFNLYYREETTNTVQMVTSKNQ